MATKTDVEKAAAMAAQAASLADNIHGITSESLQLLDDSVAGRNRCAQMIDAAGALAKQVGWLCELVAETLGHEHLIAIGDAKAWLLPPGCKD